MSLQLDKVYKRNMQNPWQTIEEETIIIDPRLQSSFELNDMGSVIWNLMDGHHSIGDVFAKLQESYEVLDDILSDDLYEFVEDLKEQNLIIEVNNEL